jgi:hypothetical protein
MELAARVQAAAGADRDLDLAIARHFRVTVWMRNDEGTGNYETTHWHYTASIDHAMSLVLKGCDCGVNREQGRGVAWVSQPKAPPWCPEIEAATPALALTAAALRSRALSPCVQKGGEG